MAAAAKRQGRAAAVAGKTAVRCTCGLLPRPPCCARPGPAATWGPASARRLPHRTRASWALQHRERHSRGTTQPMAAPCCSRARTSGGEFRPGWFCGCPSPTHLAVDVAADCHGAGHGLHIALLHKYGADLATQQAALRKGQRTGCVAVSCAVLRSQGVLLRPRTSSQSCRRSFSGRYAQVLTSSSHLSTSAMEGRRRRRRGGLRGEASTLQTFKKFLLVLVAPTCSASAALQPRGGCSKTACGGATRAGDPHSTLAQQPSAGRPQIEDRGLRSCLLDHRSMMDDLASALSMAGVAPVDTAAPVHPRWVPSSSLKRPSPSSLFPFPSLFPLLPTQTLHPSPFTHLRLADFKAVPTTASSQARRRRELRAQQRRCASLGRVQPERYPQP